MNYDVIIPIVIRNINTIEHTVTYLRKNNKEVAEVFVVGKSSLKDYFSDMDVSFIDEDRMIEGLTYEACRSEIIKKDKYAGKRSGWYLQQFIKMGYSRLCKNDYYLVWDADTILLNQIDMFDSLNKPYFDMKTELHYPYFYTINKLFNGMVKKTTTDSFISEHMIINTDLMNELLTTLSANSSDYWKRIIQNVDTIDIAQSGFSEFETYGNYVDTFYPGFYKHRTLRTCRDGEKHYGNSINEGLLAELALKYDTVTFENRK